MKRPDLAFLALALFGPPALAQDVQPSASVHGFVSAGYIATSGNNFYGHTLNGGDVDFYEMGINGFVQLHPQVSVSGQVLARKAGETDDGNPRLDYGFVDLQAPGGQTTRFGLRLGRVRNPIGFYNDTRDVVFTRPSILLPQSAYSEGNGIRTLVFSSDGGQLYADWDHGSSHTAFSLTLATDRRISDRIKNNATEVTPPFRLENSKLRKPVFAQLLHEMDGGRVRLAFSYVGFKVDFDLVDGDTGESAPLIQDSKTYLLSAQYNAENWILTSEYTRGDAKNEIPALGFVERVSQDGIYLQWQYRCTPTWTTLLRYDIVYPDRKDRSAGSSRDSTFGVRWAPDKSWSVSAEYHRINGTMGIPRADNFGRSMADQTDLLAVMLGYRF